MVHNDWWPWLQVEWAQPYFKDLASFVHEEYAHREIYPPKAKVFSAFENTDYPDVRVVILGQDPYHEPGQAEGLSFSVKPGIDIPPSLQNIYKELESDIPGFQIPNNGSLTKWADQGVFLLNTLLTVKAHQAFSCKGWGWEEFTDAAIRALDQEDHPMVFLLWGKPAQEKAKLLHDNPNHLVLMAPHPSPLSAYRGFFGCHHFSKANEFLIEHGLSPIDWQIENV